MYILGLGMLIAKLFRNIFFLIDSVIFSLIPKFYNLLLAIARTSPLSQGSITDMASRIYKLLAVFMIFKVTFSLIMYVVNPEDFSDKSKGVSKLITNIVISLALLVLTPTIFSYAYQFQNILLKNNTLAVMIFGEDKYNKGNFLNNAGDKIAYLTMSPFLVPNSLYFNCTKMYDYNANDEITLEPLCFGFEDAYEYAKESGACNDPNISASGDNSLQALCSSSDIAIAKSDVATYAAGVQSKNFGLFFRSELINAYYDKDKSAFAFDYYYIISTLVGILVVLFLITTCMDVGLRSIKLAFLQLIAPIPILSYIDPKSGKDGMFKKWCDMAFKTYLHLFVRLLALYFALYVISRVDKLVDVIDGSYVTNGLIRIFIIIGALMFAKNFIKILESLGIKFDGGFEINPIKKFNEQALGGKRITGAAGALTASTVDRASRIATATGAKGKLMALAGAPIGALGSTVRGFRGDKGFSGGLNAQASVNRRLREGRIKGLSPVASYFDYAGSIFGLDDATLERESFLINRNKEEIRKADNAIGEYSRQREVTINSNKRKITPAKDVQARRKSAMEVASKMQNMAEDIASKKADFKMSDLNKRKMELMSKAKNDANSLTAGEIAELANNGIAVGDLDGAAALAYERAINQRSYTSNRRSDEANVRHLTDNQGKALDHDMIIGGVVDPKTGQLKQDSYYIVKKGTVVDSNVVAQAQAAQGMYVKASKKAVFDDLMSGDAIKEADGKALDEVSQFQADLKNYEDDVNFANEAIEVYNNGLSESERSANGISKVSVDMSNYDEIDKVLNDIKSSEDTRKLNDFVSSYETANSKLSTEIERFKDNYKVKYYDKNNKEIVYDYDRAVSENKARDEENKHNIEQHQQRRSYVSDMAKK